MKILIIRNYPSYMAIKDNTYNIQEIGLAKALIRKGNKCDVLFWTNKKEEVVQIPVGGYGTISVFYKRGITKLKNTVFLGCDDLYGQYDILQPCEYNQIQSWILAKKYPNKTFVYHGPYYSAFNKKYNLMCGIFDCFFLQRYIRLGTPFIVKSKLAADFLIEKGIKKEKVKIIGVGIDTQMLNTDKKCNVNEFVQKIKSKNSILKILYIGQFEERRNIDFIFKIFARLLQNNPDAELYMIGSGQKRYLQAVFNYALKLRIKDQIIWTEKMPQKYLSMIYKQADFFLLPTRYEIFGMVILEAMYYQTVVLTTSNGGSNTLIENEVDGVVIDENDADKWASKIAGIYADKRLMDHMKTHASKKIKDAFTWDALAEKFIESYQYKVSRGEG